IIHELRTRLRATNDIYAKVQTYIREVTGLSDPSTSGQAAGTSGQYVWNFTDAIRVFATMTETPEVGHPLAPAIDYNALAVNRLVQLEQYKILQRQNRTPRQLQARVQPQRPFTKYKS
ncbi:hypothetical protein BGZ70_006767, partial [Mortierella alpina]